MIDLKCKAVVAGAGPAGLATAGLLAQAGVDTICVAPVAGEDPRTTALMHPSIRLLEHLGVWTEDLRQHCAPLKQLHLLDDTGNLVQAPDLRFSSEEAQLEAFGWNTPLNNLLPALRKRAEQLGVRFVEDVVASVEQIGNGLKFITQGGQIIHSEFAVAADGRNSLVAKSGRHCSFRVVI